MYKDFLSQMPNCIRHGTLAKKIQVVHKRMSCGHSSGCTQIVCALGPRRTITREGIAV